MKLFDLHCDTITVLEEQGKQLFANDLQVSLERAADYDAFAQIFAVFIPDTLRGQAAVAYFDRVHAFYEKQMQKNSDLIFSYFDSKDTKMKAILSVEGGAAAAGTIEGLRHLSDCDVRLMTLTWNAQNEIASGCWAEPDTGLTAFGINALREMERLSMVADVSHLSKRGFWDVAEHAKKPFVASHSNCDLTENEYGRRRNLDDAQIRCLVERGGLMGINLCPDFLGDKGDASFDAVYRHISHALDTGAEHILAMGCDLDGCDPLPELAAVEKLRDIYEYLLSKNMNEALCERIFYGNADKFFGSLA
ncbi:MAG: membrane dipeptidase [Oscillospiraceae bacterium]|nr:membrane dipeptidase [Oscillospiraceae bacterium]